MAQTSSALAEDDGYLGGAGTDVADLHAADAGAVDRAGLVAARHPGRGADASAGRLGTGRR